MMAKITKRSDFSGIVNYQIDDKKQAKIIDYEGVLLGDTSDIIASFEMQLAINSIVKNPVYHIALNFSKEDIDKLSDEKMVAVAREYMQKMGIANAQYIAVRHFDKEHPHLHLCINRIDNNGKIISDKYDLVRSSKICKELTQKHNLHFAQGKDRVNRDRLKGADKVRYQIYDSLVANILKSKNWEDLRARLKQDGIDVIFKYKGKTNEVQGVIFSKNGYQFSGSKVDKKMSYSKISQQMGFEVTLYDIDKQVSNGIQGAQKENNALKNTVLGALSILTINDGGESEGTNNNDNKKKRKGFKR